MKRFPPYGLTLDAKLTWNNKPLFVVVCVGLNAWNQAKSWQSSPNDISVLVIPDGQPAKIFKWPVFECDVFIERLPGPGDCIIFDAVKIILSFGANVVIVWDKCNSPRFIKYWPRVM